MGDALEIIKFMCKELWLAVFKKQVDNLRTNHRVRTYRWVGSIKALLVCRYVLKNQSQDQPSGGYQIGKAVLSACAGQGII